MFNKHTIVVLKHTIVVLKHTIVVLKHTIMLTRIPLGGIIYVYP